MNSRERIITALNHKEPDKVPFDFGGTLATTITSVAYNNLRKYLNLKEVTTVMGDPICDTVRIDNDILELYEIDTLPIYIKDNTICGEQLNLPTIYEDEFGIEWKRALDYYCIVSSPMKNGTKDEIKKINWERYVNKDLATGLKESTERLYNDTEYCLIADIPFMGPFEGGCKLRGYDNFLIDLCLNKDFARELIENLTLTAIKKWEIILDQVGPFIQVAALSDDLGMQQSSYISPSMYRDFFKSSHKEIIDFIHTKTNAKIFLHSCGSVYNLIPDFIEIGIDILNPVQRFAADMNIEKLKKEFGDDICFWGGAIDVQRQLPFFNFKEIEEVVKKTLDVLAPGGGYVFFPTHNIQTDISPDKINFLFKIFQELRNYYN